jgi:hypothetical protein
LRLSRIVLGVTSAAVTGWVGVAAVITQAQSSTQVLSVRGEIELVVTVALTLLATLVLRGAAAGVVLAALGAGLALTGLLSGAAWSPDSAPLFWAGLASIGAGILAAAESRRAYLVIPGALVLGILVWIAEWILVRWILDR